MIAVSPSFIFQIGSSYDNDFSRSAVEQLGKFAYEQQTPCIKKGGKNKTICTSTKGVFQNTNLETKKTHLILLSFTKKKANKNY